MSQLFGPPGISRLERSGEAKFSKVASKVEWALQGHGEEPALGTLKTRAKPVVIIHPGAPFRGREGLGDVVGLIHLQLL